MKIDYFKDRWSHFKGVMTDPFLAGNMFDLTIASSLINLLSLALPLTLMQVYDRILVNKAISTLIWLVVGCALCLIMETCLQITRSAITGWIAARFEHQVGCSTVERFLNCRLEDFEKDEFGVQMDRLGAISTLRSFYGGQIFQILMDLPFAFLFLFAVWYVGGTLVYFPLAVIISFLTITQFFKFGFESARKKQQDLTDRRFNYLIELFGGIHSVKALAMEEQMIRRYESLQANEAQNVMKVTRWNYLPVNLAALCGKIIMFGILGFGASFVIDGTLTIGGLTACTMLGVRAFQPIQNAAGFWMRFSAAKIARGQLQHIACMQPDVTPDKPPLPMDIAGSVNLNSISFCFRNDLPMIINNLSLSIEAREFIGINAKGASGSTTLFYLIMGALRPEKGTVYIDEYNLAEWDISDLRGRIDYLPQSGVVFKGTIIENITLFNHAKYSVALDAAGLLGLDDLVAQLPMGYETQVGGHLTNLFPFRAYPADNYSKGFS
ncbi:MAG: ATP-binding cassette domain-containing protein [Desulfamplus sp.]|nr:ATP-binding cassette domain-containing protein [Desulfamplus sp.]